MSLRFEKLAKSGITRLDTTINQFSLFVRFWIQMHFSVFNFHMESSLLFFLLTYYKFINLKRNQGGQRKNLGSQLLLCFVFFSLLFVLESTNFMIDDPRVIEPRVLKSMIMQNKPFFPHRLLILTLSFVSFFFVRYCNLCNSTKDKSEFETRKSS